MSTPERVPGSGRLIAGATGDWEVVVGMEVHAQVTSQSKLFSGASTAFGGAPNSHVSLVDAAMPGMLPVLNRECVAQAVRTGLGLKARINLKSRFERKNYFYPDLPQGYQISQYQQPIVGEGVVTVDVDGGDSFTVGIERLHLEQDAGKSLHDQHATASFVDLNRSGVALMEIVSKPDIRSSDEAKAYLGKLRSILRYLGTCDGNMDEGSLKADVNVSVRKPGAPLGTRCEIKNMNSIRFIGEAIEFEARRQIAILEDGGSIDQETRRFDPDRGETRPMRSKEEAHDYRYFPDPDLLPLEFEQAFVDELAAGLPELPDDKRKRYIQKFALLPHDANRLVADREMAEFFEATLEELKVLALDRPSNQLPFEACKWVSGTLAGALRYNGLTIEQSRVTPQQLARVISLIFDPEYGRQLASQAFMLTWDEGGDPRELLEARGLKQLTDTGAIEKIVEEVIAANPAKAADARAKPQAIGWFVGQVMKASGGKANPQTVNALLKAKLGL